MNPDSKQIRSAFLAAYRAALRAVDPYLVTRACLRGGDRLAIGGTTIDTTGGIRLLAVGKGAHGMARATVAGLGDRLVAGLVIADHHRPSPHPVLRVMVGDHPYPGRSSLAAGRAALSLASEGRPDELLLVLVSGGGSSLMEVPARGITFEDLQQVGRTLVTGGVPITEMNIVRRHLSAVKNGGVLEVSRAGEAASLLISDVVDGPPSAIASGPTLGDGTTVDDALAVLIDYRLQDRVPRSVVEFLRRSSRSSSPAGEHPFQVIADGPGAAAAARRRLEEEGLETRVSAGPVIGEAEGAARSMVAGSVPGLVDVCWGETTVRIDTPTPGRGGRNQHAALVAAGQLRRRGRGVFGALATDGVDGISEAAGGVVDAGTVARGEAAGLDRRAHLESFDSSPYLEACGDLIITGPTGANVGDLWLVTG